jgi:hypothetical protein
VVASVSSRLRTIAFVYLCPFLLLAWKGKAKPWFRSGSKERSNRANGVALQSVLVAWPFMLTIFVILRQAGEASPPRLLLVLPVIAIAILHFLAIPQSRSRMLVQSFAHLKRPQMRGIIAASTFVYALYLIASTIIAEAILKS